MQLVAEYAERQVASDRMHPGEEPMDISIVQKNPEQDTVLYKGRPSLRFNKGPTTGVNDSPGQTRS